MNSGNTMLRVYAAIKTRIMAAEFAPGERLDPARLAPDLGSSRTPVRDALLRLSGERLVDSWQHEGFRMPFISEPAIRDLYLWSSQILHLALTAGADRSADDVAVAEVPRGYTEVIAQAFHRVANRSPNHEHRAAIASVIERSATFRIAEAKILNDAMGDVEAINAALDSGSDDRSHQAIEGFHNRRIEEVARIASELRPRAGLETI